jgi:signal transduction histidine kinase
VTRRILLVLLGLTAVIIAGAMVPLALNAIAHDRSSFMQNTVDTVINDAMVAQARLDNEPDGPLVNLLHEVREAGDGLLILRVGSAPVANQGMPPVDWRPLAARANNQHRNLAQPHRLVRAVTETTGSWVLAAVPVYSHNLSPLVGTVILARSAAPLNHSILALWLILGTIGVAALVAAALLAFALARWVSRPLAGLDSAAGKLAEGDLTSRAVTGSGPPELRRLATTFNTMAGRLEALVHGNRAVIADVSHQLRTPLAALRLRLDLLAADTDPVTGHELVGALDELARLSRLVDGLLAVARAENVVPVPTAVNVAEVARERVVAWHPVADDRGIVLLVRDKGGKGGGKETRAWMAEGHLEQVLDNLIANALEALSAGDQILVTTAATATSARITVTDNGPGMNAEDRERAFLRFSTSNPNGTGLGLAIVHRLATANGGTASLTETPGGGLTATLEFPGLPALGNSTLGNSTASPAALADEQRVLAAPRLPHGGRATLPCRPLRPVGKHQYPGREARRYVREFRNVTMFGFRFGNEQAR